MNKPQTMDNTDTFTPKETETGFEEIVPFLGDLFDIVWKANEKNMALLEEQIAAAPPANSPETRLKAAVFIILGLMLAGVTAIAYLGFTLFLRLIAAL